MSRALDRLSAIAVKNLVKPGFHHDGGGLYLQVSGYGTKSWVLRYTLNKKVRDMGLGPLSDWTLAEARERAKRYRQLIAEGIDPLTHREEARREREEARRERQAAEAEAARLSRTFEECATEYHKENKDDWKNAKHSNQWINTLKTYAFPIFGTVPVSRLDREQFRKALHPIWKTKAETASRVLQRVRTVMNYAAAMGYTVGLDSEQWKQLKESLPKNSKQLEHVHHASCPHDEVGDILQMVRSGSSSQSVKLAFEYVVLTAARSGEVRMAVWGEISEKQKTWTIPKERMKAGRQHSVPLSDIAWEILQSAKRLKLNDTGPGDLIFPGPKKKALSDMTFTQILRRLKVDHTMHGFRASFRTWGAEVAHYDHDILEHALAHVVGDTTVRAYQRSDMLEKRRGIMQAWADYTRTTSKAVSSNS